MVCSFLHENGDKCDGKGNTTLGIPTHRVIKNCPHYAEQERFLNSLTENSSLEKWFVNIV